MGITMCSTLIIKELVMSPASSSSNWDRSAWFWRFHLTQHSGGLVLNIWMSLINASFVHVTLVGGRQVMVWFLQTK